MRLFVTRKEAKLTSLEIEDNSYQSDFESTLHITGQSRIFTSERSGEIQYTFKIKGIPLHEETQIRDPGIILENKMTYLKMSR